MKTNKKILFLILLASVLILPLGALAQVQQLPEMITNIQRAAGTIGASIIIIGWIIAGILYLTSAGSPEKTATAKKALFACVVGTILIILATVAQATICQLLYAGQCR